VDSKDKINMFQEFSENSWEQGLFLFREATVKRFGFITCTTDPNQQKSSMSNKKKSTAGATMAHKTQDNLFNYDDKICNNNKTC
jgi:hypothetical protein